MTWTVDPINDPAPQEVCCLDGSCPLCLVKAAGARTIGDWVGFDYDRLDGHAQLHYRELCGAIMAAMSSAMLETGIARVRDPR